MNIVRTYRRGTSITTCIHLVDDTANNRPFSRVTHCGRTISVWSLPEIYKPHMRDLLCKSCLKKVNKEEFR